MTRIFLLVYIDVDELTCTAFSACVTEKIVSAITAIKAKYRLIKNWVGDPCAPKNLVWDGLNCSYPISRPQRITSV